VKPCRGDTRQYSESDQKEIRLMASQVDPFTLALFRSAITSLGDEMALTIYRTSYSGVLKDIMDYSTALCDPQGRLVAQGLTLAGHLCSIPVALKAALARFGDDVHPGDVICMNDPFEGGMHLPDIFVFKPIFIDERMVSIAATICHHTDVGGRVPGSNASDSTEIYQEGLRIPPLKLFERGRRNDTLWTLIERNVRLPVRLFGDLRAQLAACHIAESGVHDLVARYGTDAFASMSAALLDHSEQLTRACLAELPDGMVSFEDWIDDDGIDVGKPIRLFVTLDKRGDRLVADWTGTSPQVKGAINNTYSYTQAATLTAVKSVLSVNMPNNDGVFRAIEVIAPAGTVANGVLPAACAARGLTGFRMVDCCFGALGMLVPDRVFAASDGGNTGITIGGWTRDRQPFIYVDFMSGSWGGRPWADGIDGNANMFANMASQSVEILESEQPVEILAFEFVQDAGGPGRYRGGVPYRRDYRFLEDEAVLQVRSDRHTHRPYGLWGGYPGKPSRNILDPCGAAQTLPSKLTMTIRQGDTLRHELPGSGGWGDPLDRDPAAVLRDVRNEFVSISAARADYGVVILGDPLRVDAAATRAERDKQRSRRGWSETPAVVREVPLTAP
jgi:N-methylhydantoinase B